MTDSRIIDLTEAFQKGAALVEKIDLNQSHRDYPNNDQLVGIVEQAKEDLAALQKQLAGAQEAGMDVNGELSTWLESYDVVNPRNPLREVSDGAEKAMKDKLTLALSV